jgi:hypothetical protein
MSLYELALFAHIVGALGAFVGLGLEWQGRRRLSRTATVGELREFERLGATLRVLQSVAGAALVLAGLCMTLTVWGFRAWIVTGLGGLLSLVVLGAMTGQRTARLLAGIGTVKPLLPAARQAVHDPILSGSLRLRVALALGVVFLMVTKPGVVGALATIGIAIAAAVLLSVPALLEPVIARARRSLAERDSDRR